MARAPRWRRRVHRAAAYRAADGVGVLADVQAARARRRRPPPAGRRRRAGSAGVARSGRAPRRQARPREHPRLAAAGVVAAQAAQLARREPGERGGGAVERPARARSARRSRGAEPLAEPLLAARPPSAPSGSTRRSRSAATRSRSRPGGRPRSAARRRSRPAADRAPVGAARGRSPRPGAGRSRRAAGRRRRSGPWRRRPAPASGRGRGCRTAAGAAVRRRAGRGGRARRRR